MPAGADPSAAATARDAASMAMDAAAADASMKTRQTHAKLVLKTKTMQMLTQLEKTVSATATFATKPTKTIETACQGHSHEEIQLVDSPDWRPNMMMQALGRRHSKLEQRKQAEAASTTKTAERLWRQNSSTSCWHAAVAAAAGDPGDAVVETNGIEAMTSAMNDVNPPTGHHHQHHLWAMTMVDHSGDDDAFQSTMSIVENKERTRTRLNDQKNNFDSVATTMKLTMCQRANLRQQNFRVDGDHSNPTRLHHQTHATRHHRHHHHHHANRRRAPVAD